MKRYTASALSALSAAALLSACAPKAEDVATPKAETPPPAAAPDAADSNAGEITDSSTPADVHARYIIPGSNALFAAESEPPASDEEWASLRSAAADVITGAGFLAAPSRSRGEDWNANAEAVIAATKETAAALDQNNADELVFTDGDMMSGCSGCHQTFREPTKGAGLPD